MRDRGETVKSISTEGWIRGGEESVSLEAILFLGSARLVGEALVVKRNWKETKRLGGLLEEDTIGRAAFSCKNEFSSGTENAGGGGRARGAITWKEFDGGVRGMLFI